MMELFDAPNDWDDSQKKSQEPGVPAARGNGSKTNAELHPPPAKALDSANEDPESDELEEILASIFDLPLAAQPASRKPVSREQRAAEVVVRSGNLASTDGTFREYSRRLTRYLSSDPEAEHSAGDPPDVSVASLSLLEESSLIHAMFRAASRAGNEKEAGLLAVASIPLILQQYPRVARALWTVIPGLSLGVEALTRFLHRSEMTRPLIVDLPRLLRRSLDRLARQVLQRQTVSSVLVSMLMAEQTRLWLASHLRRGEDNQAARSLRSRGQRPLKGDE